MSTLCVEKGLKTTKHSLPSLFHCDGMLLASSHLGCHQGYCPSPIAVAMSGTCCWISVAVLWRSSCCCFLMSSSSSLIDGRSEGYFLQHLLQSSQSLWSRICLVLIPSGSAGSWPLAMANITNTSLARSSKGLFPVRISYIMTVTENPKRNWWLLT